MLCYHRLSRQCSKFQFPNELEMEWAGRSSNPTSQIVSHLKSNKILSKGYLCHLVEVNELEHEVPSIDSMSIVNEFKEFFQEDLARIPPER